MEPKTDLRERSFGFAVRIIKLCGFIQNNHRSVKVIVNQMIRSGTSIGANIEEAKGAQSKADFLAKYHIALKEARETHYWIRLLLATNLIQQKRLQPILNECEEIIKMLVASLITAKKSR
jgi:four helix bundle protein